MKFFFYFLLILPYFSLAQSPSVSLTNELTSLYQSSVLPGFGVAIVNENQILYEHGFGFAEVGKAKPYEVSTVQNIGSISKTFIGVALMQMVEKGSLDLDEDINNYLPFPVRNPRFPKTPITLKHLSTHTSGIFDSEIYNNVCYVLLEKPDYKFNKYSKNDSTYLRKIENNQMESLGSFLNSYLMEGGTHYTPENYTENQSGEASEYSNVASALAAYIIELQAGIPFAEYVAEYIFKPLGMKQSRYAYLGADSGDHATTYFANGSPVPKYQLVTYPDGGIRTCVHDLATYLSAMMKGYFKGKGILKDSSFTQMMTIQSKIGEDQEGIFWDITRKGSIGHNGADPGVFTYMLFNPDKKYGLVFMTNTIAFEDEKMLDAFQEIWKTMSSYQDRI